MSLQRFVSVGMILAGVITCLSGMESAGRAECDVSDAIYPAICIPGHQIPPQGNPNEEDTNVGCINYYYLWCWPDPEIGCWTEGYGGAVGGACEHYLEETGMGFCFENYTDDVVVLQYHRSECEFFDANCQCIWVIGEQPPVEVPICDCAQVI